MKRILTGVLGFLWVAVAIAQQIQPCLTDELYAAFKKAHPEAVAEENYANSLPQQPALGKAGAIRYIPVVFHVIHKYGFENITHQQITDALRIMNEDFRKKAGTNGGTSTDSRATDMQIEFRLAQRDPNGNPTDGVNRIFNDALTDNASDASGTKQLSYWNSSNYFNVWVVNSINNNTGDPNNEVLGYAQFPMQHTMSPSTDGILVRADQVGSVMLASNNQWGRTLTHESGHWVGLYHPFEGGCGSGSVTSSNCNSQGDRVCDTPPVSTSTKNCPATTQNTCTNDVPDLPDNVKNYMDYADGSCMNMFTAGQLARVNTIMPAYRSNVYSDANLALAGINPDGTYKPLTASTVKAPYKFGFDVSNIVGAGWLVENYMSPGDSGWAQKSGVSFAGGGCMFARNFNNLRLNARNAFVSPSVDISNLATPTLTFYLAYAKKQGNANDKLNIYVSNNYGLTETLVKTLTAADMETASSTTAEFVPGSSQWKQFFVDLSGYRDGNCRVRLELQSLRGNNIYIDEFQITNSTDVATTLKTDMDFNLFPNPFSESAKAVFTLPGKENVEVTVLDIMGKEVKNIFSGVAEGRQEIVIDRNGLSAGIYLLNVQTSKGGFSQKFIVN
jgi:hypothetical protein